MAWDATGWTYHKVLTVDQTDDLGAGTNYQMKLLIGKASGATGEQVDCGGHCEDDFDDLRFSTDAVPASATLLDYWIESVVASGTSYLATVWIEVPMPDDAADTTIRMYYGNAGAAAVSNGASTFGAGMFDDFEWGNDGDAIDTSGGNITWTKSVAGTSAAEIDTTQDISDITGYTGTRSLRLYRDGTNTPWAKFALTAGTAYAIRYQFRKTDTAVFNLYHGDAAKTIYLVAQADETIQYYSDNYYNLDTPSSVTKDEWELFELNDINCGTPKFDVWFKGVKVEDNAAMYAGGVMINSVGFYNISGTSTIWIDDVIVRKWTANEPTWSSFGAETSAGGWANIASINGVASSGIASVNGVAEANIAKIYGVAV